MEDLKKFNVICVDSSMQEHRTQVLAADEQAAKHFAEYAFRENGIEAKVKAICAAEAL